MNTRAALAGVSSNVEESMGVRTSGPRSELSPVPQPKDTDRRPLREYGEIPTDSVVPDPNQPRKEFDADSIKRFAQNIVKAGQINPIRVRWSDALGKWIIVAGERRWRAIREAGLPTIRCFFHERELNEPEILEESLIENIHRKDLMPIEEAQAYAQLIKANDWSRKQLAEAIGVDRSKVTRSLALLELPPDIQSEVENGKIAARSAYEMSKLNNSQQQRDLAAKAADGELTHKQAATNVRQRSGKSRRERGTKLTMFAENGWRITVSGVRKGSYHEIEAALVQALDEVRHRMKNRVRL